MAPGNPVAQTAFQAEQEDWVKPAQAHGNRGRWWALAPALSGLAVIAVVVGLTLAGGSAPRRPGPEPGTRPGALPRFYVTINGLAPKETAIVHNTATGQALTSVHIPDPSGEIARITAARSDRVFYISTGGYRPGGTDLTSVILRLTLSADGRSAVLTRLPIFLGDPAQRGGPLAVQDIAVSPDGSKLAAIIQLTGGPGLTLHPVTEIELVPLRPGRGDTFWRAAGDFAFGFNATWVSGRGLAFLWQDQFKGNETDFMARTAERLLNTASGNRNLLASAVLARGGGSTGFIQSAYAAPGGPIIAALASDTPATGPKGTARARLVAISPATGAITKVFASRTVHYRNLTARFYANYSYEVLGLDASGKNALVFAPRFGVISQGTFKPLPAGPGHVYGAAW